MANIGERQGVQGSHLQGASTPRPNLSQLAPEKAPESHPPHPPCKHQVPIGDGTLKVSELSEIIMKRFLRLRPGETEARAEQLEDGDGALLFPDERVCDVLFDKGRAVATLSGKFTQKRDDGGAGKRPTKRIKGAGGQMEVVAVCKYTRDEEMHEYVTPTPEEIMDVDVMRQEKRIKCPMCDDMFSTAQKLTYHIKTHKDHPGLREAISSMADNTAFSDDKARRFFCPSPNCVYNCAEDNEYAHPFRDFPTLRKHFLRTHVNEKPHKCSQCDKAFALRGDMLTHAKGCGGKWQCVCGTKFTQRGNLNTHIKRMKEGTHGFLMDRSAPPAIAGAPQAQGAQGLVPQAIMLPNPRGLSG